MRSKVARPAPGAKTGPSPISSANGRRRGSSPCPAARRRGCSRCPSSRANRRSEEHTSELQSLMRISYAVFCLKKKKRRDHELFSKHLLTDIIAESVSHGQTPTDQSVQQ